MAAIKNLTDRRWVRISFVTAVLLASLYALFVLLYRRNKRFRRRFQMDAYTSMTRVSDRKAKSKAGFSPQNSPVVRNRRTLPRDAKEVQNPKREASRHRINNSPSDAPNADPERRTVYSASSYRSSGASNVPPADKRSRSENRSRNGTYSGSGGSGKTGENRTSSSIPRTDSRSGENRLSGKTRTGSPSYGAFAKDNRKSTKKTVSGTRETANRPIRQDRVPEKRVPAGQPTDGDKTSKNRIGFVRSGIGSERPTSSGSTGSRSETNDHPRENDRR